MKKLLVRDNFRVEVVPRHWGSATEQQKMDDAQAIAKQIHRHIDDIDTVSVDWDGKTVCGHCGLDWEEDEDGVPCCCRAAQVDFEKEHEPVTP